MADLSSMTKYQWAQNFLQQGGWPVSAHNLAFIVAWIDVEGTSAAWNPLATTRQAPGSSSFNSVGVQNFADFQSGLNADIGTVKSYGAISAALASGDPGGVLQPSSFWGSYSGSGSHGDPTGVSYVNRFKGIYGAYLNHPDTMNTPLLAAGAGSTSSPPGSYGGTGSTTAQGGTTANPQVHFKLPAGGTLFRVNGTMVVVYRVGDTLIYYDGSEAGITGRADTTGLAYGGAMTGTQFSQLAHSPGGLVHGGVWSELSAPDIQQAGSYTAWIQKQLTIISGGNTAWMHDNGVMQLMLQYAAGNISMEEMLAKLKGTTYWKSRTESQRQWEQKSPADQKLSIQDAAAQLADTYFATTGQQIDPTDRTLLDWAQKIASGQSSTGIALATWIRPVAEKLPQSPWSRQIEQEKENQRQQGVDISNEEGRVRDLYKQWGISIDDATATSLASKLVTKTMSEEQLTTQLQQQAQTLYPNKPLTMDTATWAQPWISTYQRVMEQPADLQNGTIARALQNGQTPYDYEKELKMTPGWLQTTNGRQSMQQAFSEVGRRMGFVK